MNDVMSGFQRIMKFNISDVSNRQKKVEKKEVEKKISRDDENYNNFLRFIMSKVEVINFH